MTGMELFQGAVIDVFYGDIGGTNVASPWRSMAQFEEVVAHVQIGTTWNAADDLDQCQLQQATSSGGAGAKALTRSGAGTGYDTGNPIDATGNFVRLAARAEDLDSANGFHYVRVIAAEGGNTGVDEVLGCVIYYAPRYHAVGLAGAASVGNIQYVTPDD